VRRWSPRPFRLRQSSILPWHHPLRRSSRTSPSHPTSLAKCRVLCGRRLLRLRQPGRVSTYRSPRGRSMFPAAPPGSSPATILLRRRGAQVRSNGGTSNCLRRSSRLLRLRPRRTTAALCLLRSMPLSRRCPPRRRTIRQHSTWTTSKIPAKARLCRYRDLRHLAPQAQAQASVVHRRWCLPLRHRRRRFQRRPCRREDRLCRP